ncbi:uncharacterized protein LOC135464942 [Liolophura sinensis]|uniref:uncharacterized protein LOC135464942 n=1 Tax=Liolophura sinensis TaxID=3198878 RepID=UPI003158BE73
MEFQEQCGSDTLRILKHTNTRWLSLAASIDRLLKMWEPLSQFFEQECATSVKTGRKRKLTEKDTSSGNFKSRPERVLHALTDPNTKLYCLFLQAAIPTFNTMNLVLQREEPMIHLVHSKCVTFLTKLLVRFITPDAITKAENLQTLDFHERKLQKSREDIVIGQNARCYMEQCKEQGLMTPKDRSLFFDSVRKYYATAATYITQKFPLNDPVLQNANVVNIQRRTEAKFSDLLYFVHRFPCIMPDDATEDDLQMEFLMYQVDPLPSVDPDMRIDQSWHLLGQLKQLDTTQPKYKVLSHVMLGILVIPHSNADSERIFSTVRKNQTEFRPNMGVPLLQSLMITKTDMQARDKPCFQQEFTADFLSMAKSATYRGINSIE